MSFCTDTWDRISSLRAAIHAMPFLQGLSDGSLPRERFDYYLTQDALYLGTYARVLAGLATQASNPTDSLFWAQSAAQSVAVELDLHAQHVDASRAMMSPTTRAYTSYLLATLSEGCYPVAVAAVLPCYWVYHDVGRAQLERVGVLDGHPYEDWISLYSDKQFAASVDRAKQIADQQASDGGAVITERMHEAFEIATRYEYLFWDAGWRQETWPI